MMLGVWEQSFYIKNLPTTSNIRATCLLKKGKGNNPLVWTIPCQRIWRGIEESDIKDLGLFHSAPRGYRGLKPQVRVMVQLAFGYDSEETDQYLRYI